MSKIKIIETTQDPLRVALGKSQNVVPYGFNKSRITSTNESLFLVSFIKKLIKDDGVLYSEETTIRLDPISSLTNFKTQVRNSVSLNATFTDHFVTIPKCDFAPLVVAENLNQTISSYDGVTNFNYISLDYDDMQTVFPEVELPSILSPKTKEDFITFKRNRKKSPFDYSMDSIKFKNFVLPNEGPQGRKDLNASSKLENFPYYNQIKISNKINNKFSSFLNKLEIFDPILESYLTAPRQIMTCNIQDGTTVRQNVIIPTFNLLAWPRMSGSASLDNFYALDQTLSKPSDMINNYKKLMFAGYVRALSQGNFRSYEEIYNNEECYKEDFVYSINKFKDVIAGPKDQTFFIPAIEDTSVLNDTQIKYGQTYIYQCQAHYIIVGNAYTYTNLKFHKDDDQDYATVKVTNVPSIIIVPLDLFRKPITAIQPPPLFPQVDFVTENNSNNKISIYLSPTKGEFIDNFISILPEDEIFFRDLQRNLGKRGSKIRFRTMPEDGLYQVFKMAKPPDSILDFKDKLLDEIRMPFVTEDAVYQDNIIPNEKYYYMFRKVNSKGVPSNPTEIFEVELLKDADDSKIIVKEYKPPKKIKSQPSRKFKSLFQISPAVEHVMFDSSQDYLFNKSTLKGSVDNLKLGVLGKSVWGRKFKFRIKSTTSGKIIDYNVTFTLTKNKTEEDF